MTPSEQYVYEKIRSVKRSFEAELMRKANVVGVGVGLRQKDGVRTDEVCLVVMVRHKVPLDRLAETDVIPATLDGVPADVQIVGDLQAQRRP